MKESTFVKSNFRFHKYTWFNICSKPFRVLIFSRRFLCSLFKGDLINKINQYISPSLTAKEKILTYTDIFFANVFYGASLVDYFTFDFYHKTGEQKREFITHEMSRKLWSAFNPPAYRELFSDKYQTYKIFREHFGREMLVVDERTSLQTFINFCSKHKAVFIKPRKSSWGLGVKKIQIDNSINYSKLFHECLDNNLIVEELIGQHPELAAFHPSSLNSIRIRTIVTKNGVRVMAPAFFKMGNNNSEADNLHSGGLFSEIDIETGILITCGIDKNRIKYERHPISNHQIKGYQIPCWDEIKSFAQELALVLPKNRYVGWDIALSDQCKPVLVEGNDHAGFLTLSQTGNRMIYEEALRDI